MRRILRLISMSLLVFVSGCAENEEWIDQPSWYDTPINVFWTDEEIKQGDLYIYGGLVVGIIGISSFFSALDILNNGYWNSENNNDQSNKNYRSEEDEICTYFRYRGDVHWKAELNSCGGTNYHWCDGRVSYECAHSSTNNFTGQIITTISGESAVINSDGSYTLLNSEDSNADQDSNRSLNSIERVLKPYSDRYPTMADSCMFLMDESEKLQRTLSLSQQQSIMGELMQLARSSAEWFTLYGSRALDEGGDMYDDPTTQFAWGMTVCPPLMEMYQQQGYSLPQIREAIKGDLREAGQL